ncbi:DUF6168 family protein [Marivirga arenosa]|uniref:DUF6168 family protein n=1 Tax=Marivirga arenosa TaxID=3059076 RepID=A0AA49GGW0_9BACT|nr:DUF6168 family protein [Marivirga sp. ABR2-2]WKK86159.1 DUF6168 family protein [Marivirga sp. ABR2-2]
MLKRLMIFTLLTLVLAVVILFAQNWYLSNQNEVLSYSLEAMYIFHFISFIVIASSVGLLSKKLPDQVGYFYLASVFIKIGLFVLIFKNTLFSEEELNFPERISIIIPFFMFLVMEAIYSGRLMNTNDKA